MKNSPLLSAVIVFAALITLAATRSPRPTLYLIGDSTVKNASDKGEGGMWGWGHFIAAHFDTTRLHVENHAIGGAAAARS